MAQIPTIPESMFECFAEKSHEAIRQIIGGSPSSEAGHVFNALVPKGTDMTDPLTCLELSPSGKILAPFDENGFITINLTDEWDIFLFAIEGNPLQQLQEMTTPRGCGALAISIATSIPWIQDEETKTPGAVEAPKFLYSTKIVARDGRAFTMTTTPSGVNRFPNHGASTTYRLMIEAIRRSPE